MHCRKCGADVSSDAQICTECGFADPGVPVSRLRQTALAAFDAIPGSAIVRRLLGRENVYAVRSELARKYLRGSGIEFGALNAPLDVPDGVKIAYADLQDNDYYIELATRQYGHVTTPNIIADIEVMDGIADSSVDFVVANQVIEHVENPLRALRTISRVLRPGGIAFISLPDKRFSFDRKRAITPLAHFIKDYEQGPEWSRPEHYDDWVHLAEGFDGETRRERAAGMLGRRANIHFHVWDFDAMAQFFAYAATVPEIGLAIVHSQQNRGEGVWILRKPAGS